MTDGDNEQNPYGQQPEQGENGPAQAPNPYSPPPTQPYAQPSSPGAPPPPYGQPGYTQPYSQPYGQPYGQPYAPQGYGQPGYPAYQGYARAPEDKGAQTSMILGIVALALGLLCVGVGFVGSPIAWYLGVQAKRRIDASNGQLGGRGNAQAGVVLGIVGTVLLVLTILAVIAFIVFLGFAVDSWDNNYDPGPTGTAA